MNENYENNMETTYEENQEVTPYVPEMDDEGTGLSGKLILGLVAGGAALVGGGIALAKKLKSKKEEDKPKKKKKFHIGFIEVDDECEDEFDEEIPETVEGEVVEEPAK